MNDIQIHKFRRLGVITVLAVYFLILVGGAVRASGAGMGCPDWPTCFGRWIPPTSVSQLPENYQQIYAKRGYANTKFNPTKTWIEYLNRLVGVSIGLFIMATMFASRHFRKTNPLVTWLSVIAFFAVVFQGWLGSRVVASNLNPGMITVHMLMAQAIVAMLIWAVMRSQLELYSSVGFAKLPRLFNKIILLAMGMTLLQMVMGTQIREAIDVIAKAEAHRSGWIDKLPIVFLIHRSFSWLFMAVNGWLVYQVWKNLPRNHPMTLFSLSLAALILSTVVIGVVMNHMNIPAFVQPLHLWFASLIFGNQITVYLFFRYGKRAEAEQTGKNNITDVFAKSAHSQIIES